jgi:hypothetical protein
MAVSAVADYLDTLSTRFHHEKDGTSSARTFFWIAESLSPVLPRLTKHVTRGRRMKLEAIKLEREAGRSVRLDRGPRGPLP